MSTTWRQGRVVHRGRRAVQLVRLTLRHLRESGVGPTLSHIDQWLERRRARSEQPETLPVRGFEVGFVPPSSARMTPCGPIADVHVVQEIDVEFDELHRLEVRLATYARRNHGQLRFSLFSSAGGLLWSARVPAAAIVDNAFAALPIDAPVVVAGDDRIYLTIDAEGATPTNAITAWTSRAARGSLRIVSGALPQQLDPVALGAPSELGGLVLRIVAANPIGEPYQRWRYRAPAGVEATTVVALGTVPGGAGLRIEVESDVEAVLARLLRGQVRAIFLQAMAHSDTIDALVREAMRRDVPTIACVDDQALQVAPFEPPAGARSASLRDPNAAVAARRRTVMACDLAVATSPVAAETLRADRKPHVVAGHIDAALLERLEEMYRRLRRPRVSIVTILYGKSRELPAVLRSYEDQSYDGELEFVFVDDCSPDDSVAIAERFAQQLRPQGARRSCRFVRNETNSGNCVSRNRGIEAASGDLLIIIDADCMLNRHFVARHVEAHAFGDCEVVIGPLNIETGSEDPLAVLSRYETKPSLALETAQLQDPGMPASFLNCITRNFSIKRGALPDEPLFDPLFGYSANPTSGFGWEDVEMGFRLYRRGARIKFIAEAFSIHVSAPPAPEGNRPARSLLNFERLLLKHPELVGIRPAWVATTFSRIVAWGTRLGIEVACQCGEIGSLIGAAGVPAAPAVRARPRRLRVLTYRWHVPHQYELWKLPIDVTMLRGSGSPMCDSWEYGQRPLPESARFRAVEEIDPRDYDLAILHFDENVLSHENCNGVIGPDWGAAFRVVMERFGGLPKIAVCHGTPQFYGQYNFDYAGADLMQPIEATRRRLVDCLADVHVVCNSHQAQREWGFHRSSVIWHGFDPAEFGPTTYARGIVSPLGPLVLSRPHYRGYFLYRKVFDGCWDELRPESLRVPEPRPVYTGNAYARAKFRNYVDELRRYSVYFNPTLRSPMPRARGEPMMCGVVPVSAHNHDVDMFIENGVDGFYANEAGELREQLRFLLRNPDKCRAMGAAARQKALRVFHIDRYLGQWRTLLAEIGR